ncbi:MAG: hypothetical protein ICV76_01485 [Nitrospiraceae bacterium]|nr:hypothetical protein [Nitrospiraceae bacterium]
MLFEGVAIARTSFEIEGGKESLDELVSKKLTWRGVSQDLSNNRGFGYLRIETSGAVSQGLYLKV